MLDLFRSFERHGVDYLLIGGQATILCGASQFTEDVGFWVRPATDALTRLLRALADLDALVYKLTPPIALRLARRGHSFHFEIPRPATELPIYVDVMARPPRVGSFARARARATRLAPSWGGSVRVVSAEDLVELKKTDRPEDYSIISRLVRLHVAEARRPTARLLAWAVANTFVVDDLVAIVRAHGDRIPRRRADAATRILLARRDPTDRDLDRAAEILSRRALGLQKLGRAYWRPLRSELKELRARGALLPLGTPVRELLAGRVSSD